MKANSPQRCEPVAEDKTRNVLERKYLTRRWVLAYLLCVVRICQTALRQCIGMALVCMTHVSHTNVAPSDEALAVNVTVEQISLNGTLAREVSLSALLDSLACNYAVSDQ